MCGLSEWISFGLEVVLMTSGVCLSRKNNVKKGKQQGKVECGKILLGIVSRSERNGLMWLVKVVGGEEILGMMW